MVSTFDAQLTVDGGLLIFVVGQLKVRCGVITSYTLQCVERFSKYVVGMRPRPSKPLISRWERSFKRWLCVCFRIASAVLVQAKVWY